MLNMVCNRCFQADLQAQKRHKNPQHMVAKKGFAYWQGSPVGSAMLAQVGQVIVATLIVWQLAFVDGCGPQKPPPKRPPVNFTCGTGLDEERDGQR